MEVRYIEVLFHTFYCNFDWAEENGSLYRGLRCIEVRYLPGSTVPQTPHQRLLCGFGIEYPLVAGVEKKNEKMAAYKPNIEF